MIDYIETESKLRLSFSSIFKNKEGIDSVLVRADIPLGSPLVCGLDISIPSGIILIVDNLTVDQIVQIVSEIQEHQSTIFELAKAKSISLDEDGDDLIDLNNSLSEPNVKSKTLDSDNDLDSKEPIQKVPDSTSELGFFDKLINLLK